MTCNAPQASYPRLQAYTDKLDEGALWGGSARRLLLRRSHSRIGECFKQWMEAARDPLSEHAATVRDAAAFELEHLDRLSEAGDRGAIKVLAWNSFVVHSPIAFCATPLRPTRPKVAQTWAAAEDLKVYFMAWVLRQSTSTKSFAARLGQHETWQQPVATAQHIAPSVLEIERLVDAFASSLIEMSLPTSGVVVRALLEAVSGLAADYARCLSDGCQSPERLIRPPPPLTRYKQSLAEKAAAGLTAKNKCAASCDPDAVPPLCFTLPVTVPLAPTLASRACCALIPCVLPAGSRRCSRPTLNILQRWRSTRHISIGRSRCRYPDCCYASTAPLT